MGGLSDQQIAAVLTFARKEFAQDTSPVTADEVKAVRAKTAARQTPWTAEELR